MHWVVCVLVALFLGTSPVARCESLHEGPSEPFRFGQQPLSLCFLLCGAETVVIPVCAAAETLHEVTNVKMLNTVPDAR